MVDPNRLPVGVNIFIVADKLGLIRYIIEYLPGFLHFNDVESGEIFFVLIIDDYKTYWFFSRCAKSGLLAGKNLLFL